MVQDRRARNVAEKSLDSELGTGYGIFAGQKAQSATLRFTPHMARWVARETWHPNQKSCFDDDGCYLLIIPYTNDTELVMDVLRYGPEVEVLEPDSLRKKVQARLRTTLALYRE